MCEPCPRGRSGRHGNLLCVVTVSVAKRSDTIVRGEAKDLVLALAAASHCRANMAASHARYMLSVAVLALCVLPFVCGVPDDAKIKTVVVLMEENRRCVARHSPCFCMLGAEAVVRCA